MSHTVKHGAEAQRRLLERWVAALARVPSVELIWLEGSLVEDRANPWSDIDLRVCLDDAGYETLWEAEEGRASLLEGIGEHLLLWNQGFMRALTAEGIVVELAVRRASEVEGLELYEWKFLLNRRPEGLPAFRKLP